MPFNAYETITIGTGNILENEEFKSAKTPAQELLMCLQRRINELKENDLPQGSKDLVAIPIDESSHTDSSEGETKTVVKIFINEFFEDATKTIDEILRNVTEISSKKPSIVLAYAPSSKIENEKFVWAENDAKAKEHFKTLWSKLRQAREEGKIGQLGIADMDLDTIVNVFEDSNYDFTILQINIATCCIPPPELVAFCKAKEIQLLTHSDPQVILPVCHFEELNLNGFKTKWVIRYLETLICRGILTKKGFIVKFQKVLT